MKRKSIKPSFVEFIPEELNDGVLYISIPYATATHKCACGCGEQVVTPIKPNDWKLIWDGETVSLSPSIGNWGFPCQSHYWITENRIVWSPKWSKWKINAGRALDRQVKKRYYAMKHDEDDSNSSG